MTDQNERAALAAQLATTGGFKGKRYRNMEKQPIADRIASIRRRWESRHDFVRQSPRRS